MPDSVRTHYERYPYPRYPLISSVRRCDTYALNLTALWTWFNGELPPVTSRRILVAGCGSFSPYPFSLANPESDITALDLSGRSLRRARLHCLLHGRRTVRFEQGDLCDPAAAQGEFGLIDAYGVIHHLPDPLQGLQALKRRLAPGGILRLMVYHRYARREEESLRRALRLLGVRDVAAARRLLDRSAPGSRVRAYLEGAGEAGFTAGLADALLHPQVVTYRIDELLELVRQAGLRIERFCHAGAAVRTAEEVERIRERETRRESNGNFLMLLRRDTDSREHGTGEACLLLNPCLREVVGRLRFGTVELPPRLGFDNPLLGRQERALLRMFLRPVEERECAPELLAAADAHLGSLFLLRYRARH